MSGIAIALVAAYVLCMVFIGVHMLALVLWSRKERKSDD